MGISISYTDYAILGSMGFFTGRQSAPDGRIPPGQTLYTTFPVLSYGPTPSVPTDDWQLTIDGLVDTPLVLSWDDLMALPQSEVTTDIHCVTRWTKLDTVWQGVWLDDIFARAGVKPTATHLLASSYGGYTTNVPLAEVTAQKAMIAHTYDNSPLTPEHGGPARLFVPALYFWKSAKWVNRLTLLDKDQPGFWEQYGYHNHGDPWKEERYSDG
jgi:DMSO/TMAO reductase YedYZ molybdopterin-dependent catalytic subunit